MMDKKHVNTDLEIIGGAPVNGPCEWPFPKRCGRQATTWVYCFEVRLRVCEKCQPLAEARRRNDAQRSPA